MLVVCLYWQIIVKAVLHVIGDDIQLAAEALQTCAGHDAGSKAAIHATKSSFDDDDTQAALLVDATMANALNLVNHQVALHNISVLWNNIHGAPIRFFITGEGKLSSTKGTTQGDPLAMAMYAIAITPLVNHLHQFHPDISQVWYTDDTAAGQLEPLLQWWKFVLSTGLLYEYLPRHQCSDYLSWPKISWCCHWL